jgi:hypothetical protein
MVQMKWRNLNVAVRIKINNGAVYIIALACAMLYAVLTLWVKPMAENFVAGEAAIWAISATMLKMQVENNKLDVDAAKAKAGDALNIIKAAAAGIPVPTPLAPDPGKEAESV